MESPISKLNPGADGMTEPSNIPAAKGSSILSMGKACQPGSIILNLRTL